MKNLRTLAQTTSALLLALSVSGCQKEFIDDPREIACQNFNKGSVTKLSPFKNQVWADEFNGAVAGDSCYTRKPTCLRRLDWGSAWDCEDPNLDIPGLNKCNWNVWEGYSFWTNDRKAAFDPKRIRIQGGSLILTIGANPGPVGECGARNGVDPFDHNYYGRDCAVTTGGVSSNKIDGYGYFTDGKTVGEGRIEMRARVRAENGTWPALWMWEQDSTHRPRISEIDIMENIGTGGGTIFPFQTLHTWPAQDKTIGHIQSGSTTVAPLPAGEWHTYGVERNGSTLKFYVDGCYSREVNNGDISFSNEGPLLVDNAQMYLILGLGADKNSGPAFQGTNLTSTLEIDYVRVYGR